MSIIPRTSLLRTTMTMILSCDSGHAKHCSRFSNHTISAIAHQKNNLTLNLASRALCREGRLREAIHSLLTTNTNTHNPPEIDSSTCLQLLETCIANKALEEGKQLHSYINAIRFTFTPSKYVILQSKLLHMYVNCGSLVDACYVFDCMTERNVFSWNMIISAYQRHGFSGDALALFHQMQQEGAAVQPNQFTFPSIVQACAELGDLKQGLYIHQRLFKSGFLSDDVVVNALVNMYAKCGKIHKARELFDKMSQRSTVLCTAMIVGYAESGLLESARQLFDQMPRQDLVSWNAMLTGYAQNGFVDKARELFDRMPLRDAVSWTAMIVGYTQNGLLGKASEVFEKMPQRGAVSCNAMIAGYARNGLLEKAREVFDKMTERGAVSWNVMVSGYAENGLLEKALETFKQMQLAGVKPSSATFASILPTCAKMGALEEGMDIHQKIVENGFSLDVVVISALIDMYAKCGSIHKARKLFDKMHNANTVSWTAMIAGYAQNGHVGKARELFDKMPHRDAVSWTVMIAGYAQNGLVEEARELFDKMPQRSTVSWNAMITGYAQNGHVEKGHELFAKMPHPDAVSWTAIIVGYAQNGLTEKALNFLKQMLLSGVKPNPTAFASILAACAKMGALEQGMGIHQIIVESNYLSDVVVVSALLDMYAKCGRMDKAQELFDKMHNANTISWTAMISGYAQNGLLEKALEFYRQMQLLDVKSNSVTFASVLSACAKMGALEQGMNIHKIIIEGGFSSDDVVTSALIDMYAKCGSINKAREVFDKMHNANMVSWTAMIAGYAMHGYSKDALKLFELMKHSGTHPDSITFVCVLFACSHGGLVDESCKYFNSIRDSYCIMPTMDHYVCMVDLLGRAGYLEEALNFIVKMPLKPNVVVWTCLLGTCRSEKDIRIGEFVATILLVLDPKCAASYVHLSNIYGEVGRWDDVKKVRTLMKDRGLKKTPGCSWIEVHQKVHAFCVGSRLHPQTKEITAKLEELSSKM